VVVVVVVVAPVGVPMLAADTRAQLVIRYAVAPDESVALFWRFALVSHRCIRF
jgi:hypothetical protein